MYNQLFETYHKCYSSKFSKQKIQDDVNEIWKRLKEYKNAFPDNVEKKVKELLQEKTNRDAVFLGYFTRQKPSTSSVSTSENLSFSCDTTESATNVNGANVNSGDSLHVDESLSVQSNNLLQDKKRARIINNNIENSSGESDADCTKLSAKRQYLTPAQDSLKAKISFTEKRLLAAIDGRDSGFAEPGIQKEIEKLKDDLRSHQKKLKDMQGRAKRQKKYRDEKKQTLQDLKIEKPSLVKALRIHHEPGRPRLENTQPEILKTIAEIAILGGGADNRRRSEMIRSCKSLNDLQTELHALGFSISRSATYLRSNKTE